MENLLGFVILVVVISALLLSPLAVIWSVNTLFSTGIAYNVTNWFATILLGVYLRSGFGKVSFKFIKDRNGT